MGIWDLLKKRLSNDSGSHHDEIEESIGKNVYEIASFDVKNASLADKIAYFLDNRSQGEQIQLADKLLREGPYEASIEMYEALIKKYPEERDRYENGIGSAYLKLGDFDKALQSYELARRHGMHPEITDKLIWDACQKQFKLTNNKQYIQKYIDSSAEGGRYLIQAQDLLGDKPLKEEPSEFHIERHVTQHDNLPEIHVNNAEAQNIDDVARRTKKIDKNQFELFGFGDEPEANATQSEDKDEKAVAEERNPDITEKEQGFFQTKKEEEAVVSVESPMDASPNMLMALDYHVKKYFSQEDIETWVDNRNDSLRIDIIHIKPNEQRPYHLLLTSGMSRQPMHVTPGAEHFRYGELAAILPESWDLTEQGLQDANNNWPVIWLRNLARIPAQHHTWLCYGHSIPHGNPPKPIANTDFVGVVILDSATLSESFQEVQLGDESLFIYTIVPVYPEEMDYKIKHGVEELRDAFADAHIPDIIYANRPTAIN